MSDQVFIGSNIRSVRAEKRMTQRELAEKAEISTSQLSAYENGKQMPGLVTLGKIAVAMETSIDRLYFGAPSEAFLNETEDFGKTVVNCFLKLKELGAVTNVHHGTGSREGSATLSKCSYELSHLFDDYRNYGYRAKSQENGDVYLKQVNEAVANEINEREKRELY